MQAVFLVYLYLDEGSGIIKCGTGASLQTLHNTKISLFHPFFVIHSNTCKAEVQANERIQTNAALYTLIRYLFLKAYSLGT